MCAVVAAACPAGNSVYLANQPDSPQLAVVDAVTINQGELKLAGGLGALRLLQCCIALAAHIVMAVAGVGALQAAD